MPHGPVSCNSSFLTEVWIWFGGALVVHLDSYNQLDFITGKSPSKRHEIVYFAEGTLGAIRIDDSKFRFVDQPGGWLGGTVKPDIPIITNLRLDPMERTGLGGSLSSFDFFKFALWRCVFVQDFVVQHAQSFIDFPPRQKPASFNLDAVKAKIEVAIKAHHAGA